MCVCLKSLKTSFSSLLIKEARKRGSGRNEGALKGLVKGAMAEILDRTVTQACDFSAEVARLASKGGTCRILEL